MMDGNSRLISSAQDGPHRDLDDLVRRHIAHPFRKPILDYNREAFFAALAARELESIVSFIRTWETKK